MSRLVSSDEGKSVIVRSRNNNRDLRIT